MIDIRQTWPQLALTRLRECTSANGNSYLAGRLGAARLLVMQNHDRQAEDDAVHVLMLAEAGE